MKKSRIVGLALPFLLLLQCGPSEAQDMGRLLDCSSKGLPMPDYKKWMKSESIDPRKVSQELNRKLPSIILGENFECIYDPILEFGDSETIDHFSSRVSRPYEYDREGYASDLFELLRSRSMTYSSVGEFQGTLTRFRHPVSIETFLTRHIQNLPFRSQMEVMQGIINRNVLHGQYASAVPVLMQTIYRGNPSAYDEFVAGLKDPPEEFTCFKDNSCP